MKDLQDLKCYKIFRVQVLVRPTNLLDPTKVVAWLVSGWWRAEVEADWLAAVYNLVAGLA